jgi:hypothetical protein
VGLAPVPVRVYTSAINIYEIANRTRLESVVLSSEVKQDDILSRLRAARPSPVSHWRIPGDVITVELIAEEMPAGDAAEFFERFMSNTDMRDWRMIPWRL